MGPLVVIIAIELIVGSSILGLSSHPRVLNNTKHQISNVLGVQQIAQTDDNSTIPTTNSSNDSSTTPPDQSSSTNKAAGTENPASSQSTDKTAPADSNNTQPTPAPADTTNSSPTFAPATTEVSPTNSPPEQSNSEGPSTDQSNSSNSPSPSETPGLFDAEINPSPTEQVSRSTPEQQSNASANPQSSPESVSSPAPGQAESNEIQTQAVLNPEELINSPDNINSQSVAEAKKEEEQLSQTQDPKEQTKLLVTFAADKVKDMSNFTKSDDFSSTNFAAQRFNSQIDQAISNLKKVPKKDQAPLKSQLQNFCNQADSVLRTVELSVPEESEQDIQMARGQCQELQL